LGECRVFTVAPTDIVEVGIGENLENDLIHRYAHHVADNSENQSVKVTEWSFEIVEEGRNNVWCKIDSYQKEAQVRIRGQELVIGSNQKKYVEKT
jgi:hypothetical protein